MSRQKIELLRSAWRRGLSNFVWQVVKITRDTFWSKRQLIFYMDLKNISPPNVPAVEGLTFRRIYSWSELSPSTLKRLERDRAELGWGDFKWLTDRKYGLWIGEVHGELTVLKFWRHSNQAADFFVDVPEGKELHWQTTVLPEFRGKRILELALYSVMEYRKSEGISGYFVSCRDYNSTSMRTFSRMGWTCLGYAETLKLSGKVTWHPLPNPVPASNLVK